MAQNNSAFVWKTSSYSSGRRKLRNDLEEVTNLKSLDFTWKRIKNLVGVFPEVVLCDIDFPGFFEVAFHPNISSIVHFVVDCVTKLVLFVSVAEADDSPAPTLRNSLLLPLCPHLLYWQTVFLILVKQMVVDFHPSALLPCLPNLQMAAISLLGHSHYSWFKSNALAAGCFYCLSELAA